MSRSVGQVNGSAASGRIIILSDDNMTAVRRPRRTRDDLRQQLLDSALVEFAAKGFDGASTRSIAKRVDAHQPQINYHFASKEALWEAAVDHLFGLLYASLGDLLPLDDVDDVVGSPSRSPTCSVGSCASPLRTPSSTRSWCRRPPRRAIGSVGWSSATSGPRTRSPPGRGRGSGRPACRADRSQPCVLGDRGPLVHPVRERPRGPAAHRRRPDRRRLGRGPRRRPRRHAPPWPRCRAEARPSRRRGPATA